MWLIPVPHRGAVPAGWHRGWAAAWPSGGLLHEERCQQPQVLPLLPRHLSISSESTSNYMVNSINGKSSSLGSPGLNASLRQRHLIAPRAGSCAALSLCRSRLSRGCFCSAAPTRQRESLPTGRGCGHGALHPPLLCPPRLPVLSPRRWMEPGGLNLPGATRRLCTVSNGVYPC